MEPLLSEILSSEYVSLLTILLSEFLYDLHILFHIFYEFSIMQIKYNSPDFFQTVGVLCYTNCCHLKQFSDGDIIEVSWPIIVSLNKGKDIFVL